MEQISSPQEEKKQNGRKIIFMLNNNLFSINSLGRDG